MDDSVRNEAKVEAIPSGVRFSARNPGLGSMPISHSGRNIGGGLNATVLLPSRTSKLSKDKDPEVDQSESKGDGEHRKTPQDVFVHAGFEII